MQLSARMHEAQRGRRQSSDEPHYLALKSASCCADWNRTRQMSRFGYVVSRSPRTARYATAPHSTWLESLRHLRERCRPQTLLRAALRCRKHLWGRGPRLRLMGNLIYSLLNLLQPDALSLAMRNTGPCCVRSFNRCNRRSGTLWQVGSLLPSRHLALLHDALWLRRAVSLQRLKH